jgi:flagellar biosynthetic protein FliS
MNPHEAALAYKHETIENAPPLKLVRLLYQAALRHIDTAAHSEAGQPGSPFIDALCRADAIVCELRLALESEHAPEISAHLEQLYLFVEHSLQRCMRERTAEGLDGARNVLATLLEAWTKIEVDCKGAAPQVGAA